jgi:hypothetical protein
MKKTLLVAIMVVMVSAAFAAEAPERRTLTVTGTAEVSVAPDICYMSFVAESRSKSANQAYKDNSALMTKVSSAIKGREIDPKDLQTVRFAITPEYHYEKNSSKRVFDGYHVTNTLYVKVRDLGKVSGVLDVAMTAGASEVGEVRFAVENPKKYTADAREDAFKAARAKAEKIAGLTGVKLGKPITISEAEPGNYGYLAQANTAIERSLGDVTETGAALERGEVKITHTVYITYEIE